MGKTLTQLRIHQNTFLLSDKSNEILPACLSKTGESVRYCRTGYIALGRPVSKVIIRTDIKEFYESIQHEPLLQRIHKDNLLTPFSRNILSGVLKSYKVKSGSNKGIPRGIGISAYLAELYMRDIDNDIQDLRGVTYYARYVDDIIIIFTPSPTEGSRDYLREVKDIVERKHKIRLNSAKTHSF